MYCILREGLGNRRLLPPQKFRRNGMIMKKLMVISVIFALVAGAVFAEINVGGAVFGKFNALEGVSNGEGKDAYASGGLSRVRLDGSGETEDGTFGGYIRLEAGGDFGGVTGWGNVWWKPIDMLRFRLGSAGYDGFFAADGVTRWGFYRDAGDNGVIPEGWAFGNSFYGGFRDGAILTVTPLEALEINVGIPILVGTTRAEEIYKKTNAQVAFTLDGIGKLAVTYAGAYQGDNEGGRKWGDWKAIVGNTVGDKERSYADLEHKYKVKFPTNPDGNPSEKTPAHWDYETNPASPTWVQEAPNSGYYGDDLNYFIDGFIQGAYHPLKNTDFIKDKDGNVQFGASGAPKFYGYFDLTMVENLGIQLGVGFTLPAKDEIVRYGVSNTDPIGTPYAKPWDANESKATVNLAYNSPVAVGLGASFETGAIGIKARVQAEFAEKFTADFEYKDRLDDPTPENVSESYEYKGPFVLTADILPSFAINDTMKVYLSAGMKLTGKATYDRNEYILDPTDATQQTYKTDPATGKNYEKVEREIDSKFGWHVQPYFTKSVGWCQTFYVGFRLWSDGDKWAEKQDKWGYNIDEKAVIKWAVPIGVSFQF